MPNFTITHTVCEFSMLSCLLTHLLQKTKPFNAQSFPFSPGVVISFMGGSHTVDYNMWLCYILHGWISGKTTIVSQQIAAFSISYK